MKHTAIHPRQHGLSLPTAHKTSVFENFRAWIKRNGPVWEENRIGITATGIFIQVTVAAIMIGIAGATGGSPIAFGTGILFAFMADSLVLAQAPMRWVIAVIAASILVNIGLTIAFAMHLL